jgi:hypothetical protein
VLIEPLDFYSASGRFDFLTGAGAHLHTAHGDRLRRVAVGEKLCRTFPFADQSRLRKSLLRNFRAFGQPGKVVKTHDLVLHPKDIRETTLWNAARERHLTAFELGLAATWAVVARARLDSFVSFAGSLTGAGARSTTESLAIPVRSGSRDEIVKPDLFWCGCLVSHSLSLYRRHFDEVTHVFDLSAKRW